MDQVFGAVQEIAITGVLKNFNCEISVVESVDKQSTQAIDTKATTCKL
jgi:hypothetical protein